MPRSIIITKAEINKRRGSNWAWHYQNREVAKMYAQQDQQRVSMVVASRVPAPVLLVDASVLDGIETLRAQNLALQYMTLSRMERTMMCVWYWSGEAWQEFVRAFQALPDVFEDHYYFYDETLDAMRIMPLSTMGKNRPTKYKKFQGEVRGKSGGSVAVPPEKFRPASIER